MIDPATALAIPMLAAVQDLLDRVEDLTERLARVEGKKT